MFIENLFYKMCVMFYKVAGDEVSAEEVDGDNADNKVPYNGLLSKQYNCKTPNTYIGD